MWMWPLLLTDKPFIILKVQLKKTFDFLHFFISRLDMHFSSENTNTAFYSVLYIHCKKVKNDIQVIDV